MNTDTMNIGISSINKFIYYTLNYGFVVVEDGYAPDFFKAFDTADVPHLLNKWRYVCDTTDSYGRVIKFYTELDRPHRVAMLNYINENYSDEQKII